MGKMKSGRVLFALAAVSYLGGCAAADTAINPRSTRPTRAIAAFS